MIAVVILSMFINAQEMSPPKKRIRIESLEVGTSTFWTRGATLNFDDINRLVGENDFAALDFDGFSMSQSCCDFQNSAVSFGLNLSLKNRAENSFLANPLLRLNVSYHSGFYSSVRFEKRESVTFDTVYVTFQGETQKHPVDSVQIDTHNFWATSERMRLNASMIWRTDPSKRWHFYTGVGFGFGLGFNSKVTSQRWIRHEILQSGTIVTPGFNFTFQDPAAVQTSFRAANPFDVSLFLPIGLDFQCFKHGRVLSRLHWFVDATPSIWFSFYPKLHPKVHPGVMGTTGLRILI